MSGRAVAEALDRAIAEHGKPGSITVNHGTAFTSRVFDEWRSSRVFCLTSSTPVCLSRERRRRSSTQGREFLIGVNGQNASIPTHCFDHVLTTIVGPGPSELEIDDGAIALLVERQLIANMIA